MTRRLDDHLRPQLLPDCLVRAQGPVGPEESCLLELLRLRIDADDRADAQGLGDEEGGHSHSAEPHHGDRVARRRSCGVDDRAAPGENSASEQGRHLRRSVGWNGHDGSTIDDRMRRERGDPQVMLDRFAAPGETSSRQQPSLGIGLGSSRAGEPSIRLTLSTHSAPGKEGHDDALPGVEVFDFATGRDHRSGRFVSQEHRQWTRPITVDHRQIGMADSRDLDFDEELGRSRVVELELGDRERPRPRVGSLPSALLQDGTDDPHRVASFSAVRGLGV